MRGQTRYKIHGCSLGLTWSQVQCTRAQADITWLVDVGAQEVSDDLSRESIALI